MSKAKMNPVEMSKVTLKDYRLTPALPSLLIPRRRQRHSNDELAIVAGRYHGLVSAGRKGP